MSQLYDPLFKEKTNVVTASDVTAAPTTTSPLSGKPLKKSFVGTAGGESIPVWYNAEDRICLPMKK